MSCCQNYPDKIFTGFYDGGHIQGIAVDQERREIYCSFTTELVRLDFSGKLIGSVRGLTGHLGCLCFCKEDGRVYGSLEYKNDEIGQEILKRKGLDIRQQNAFYVAVFDGSKITRPNMDASRDGVMTCVYLRDPVEDYLASVQDDGRTLKHRYGCSGIDGIAFGPAFGGAGKQGLCVAYGIYGDTSRRDNDYQVLLWYDISGWRKYEQPLCEGSVHQSGPERCDERYFVYTGNTTFGVQNLEYDPYTGNWLMAVYRGEKPQFPNHPLYIIDGRIPPRREMLRGIGQEGLVLTLRKDGNSHPHGVGGWEFPYGSTGMAALGEGVYYFSEDRSERGRFCSDICLYRWKEDTEQLFVKVTDE